MRGSRRGFPLPPSENLNLLNSHSKITENRSRTPFSLPEKLPGSAHANDDKFRFRLHAFSDFFSYMANRGKSP